MIHNGGRKKRERIKPGYSKRTVINGRMGLGDILDRVRSLNKQADVRLAQGKEGLFISMIKEVREPAEKAFMGFLTGEGYPGRDNPDGIPEVSLIYHDGEDVVHLQNVMLPDADKEIRGRGLAKKDILYRVDYLAGGKPGRAIGTLKAGDGGAAFLERVGCSADSGGGMETQISCGLLKKHLALCGLENLARGEVSPQVQAGENGLYLSANAAYYKEVLAYIENARHILNMQPYPVLPPFPERGPFLAEWYRDNKESGGGRQHEG